MSRMEQRRGGSGMVPPLVWIRAGQIIGLLFLTGPVADLARAGESPARVTAIVAALAAFVALFVALLPPLPSIARRGQPAIRACLAILAVTAGVVLALGAPRSFAVLFVYVVAACGLLLPPRLAGAVTATTAAGAAVALALADASSSTVAAYTLTIVAIGTMMAAFGYATRTNRRLREAREELARLAVAEERLRIARDLHDLLGHTLSLVAIKVELSRKLVATDPARAEAELTDVQQVTRQALREVRDAVTGYRRLVLPEALDGARAALTAAGIDCRIDAPGEELGADVENVLAWAVREASTNVVRHSGARTCAITLSKEDGNVALLVEDDGSGPTLDNGDGTGLAGLTERTHRLQGTLEAGARPDGGFRLRVTLPTPDE